MPFKHKPFIAILLIAIPTAVALAVATAFGWLQVQWTLTGVAYPLGASTGLHIAHRGEASGDEKGTPWRRPLLRPTFPRMNLSFKGLS